MPAPSLIQNHQQTLFSQNYSNLEKARLSLADAKKKLADRRSKLQSLQSEIVQLQAIEQQCREDVEAHSKILRTRSFVDRLVDEILFYVFLDLVEGLDSRYPWRLLSVCKRWKRVCLDHPRLWSYLNSLTRHTCARSHDTLLLMRTLSQLERSRNAPLHIRITLLCNCKVQESTFRAVVGHLPRWKTLVFTLSLVARPMLNLFPRNPQFLALQELRWVNRFPNLELPFLIEGSFPALTTFAMGPMGSTDRLQILPLGRLTSLTATLFNTNPCDLLSLLSSCTDLRSLTLHIYAKSETPAASMDKVCLPHLSHLNLTEGDEECVLPHILPNLQLPSLRHLTISIGGSIRSVSDLIQISSCGQLLEELSLSYYLTEEKDVSVVPVLQLCPNIETLSLSSSPSSDDDDEHHFNLDHTIPHLIIHPTNTNICPNLRRLDLEVFEFDPVAMIRMVDSRVNTDSVANRLESLNIQFQEGSRDPLTWGKDREYCKALLEEKFRANSSNTLNLRIIGDGYEDESDPDSD